MGPAFIGGALMLKGDKKKSKDKKSKKRKQRDGATTKETEQAIDDHQDVNHTSTTDNITAQAPSILYEDDMTEAERKASKRKLEREKVDISKIVSKTHRERVEEFNEKLSSLTELNDIPRVRPVNSNN